MYSMMDVLFRLKEGACNDWSALEQTESQTGRSWFIKGTMKEQFSPLSSFNKLFYFTSCIFFLKFFF